MRPPPATPWRGLLAIGLFAWLLRVAFVFAVVSIHDADALLRLNYDSTEYHKLALQLAAGEGYGVGGTEMNVVGLVRVPAYPALLAALLAISPAKAAVATLFLLQATLDAALALLAGLLAWRLWRLRWPAYVAATLLALSATGIGLSAAALTDGPFAFLLTVALLLMLRAAASSKAWPAVACGLIFALATLTKPTPQLWLLALPLAWWLATRRSQVPWRRSGRNLAVCLACFAAPLLAWASANWARHDVFAVSVVSERNLRYMIGPETEVRGWGHTRGVEWRTEARYFQLGHRDLWWMTLPDVDAAELVRRQRSYARDVIGKYPRSAAKVYGKNLERNVVGTWDILVNQLPPGRTPRWAELVYEPIFLLESPKVVRWAVLIVACGWPTVALATSRNARRRQAAGRSLAVLLLVLYLVLTAATTHGQGSRILYPAYPLLFALLAGWATLLPRRRR